MKNLISDSKGQLSLEYILSSMIAILIISLISVPILLTALDYSNDVIDSINAKNELNKIVDAIDFCYSSGKGSKRVAYVDFNQEVNLKLYNDGKKGFASINLNLSNDSKEIRSPSNCPILNENLHLSKGFNKLIIKWDEDSDKIEVDRII